MTAASVPTTPPRLRPPQHRVEARAAWWWLMQGALWWLPLVTGAWIAYTVWASARPWLIVVAPLASLLTLISMTVEPTWRYRVHRWEITEEAVYGLSGWWVQEWRVAPISRIQTVDAVRGPLEQLLGLSTLRVTTASSKGAINIPGIDHEVAAEVAERLTRITQLTPGDAT